MSYECEHGYVYPTRTRHLKEMTKPRKLRIYRLYTLILRFRIFIVIGMKGVEIKCSSFLEFMCEILS